MSALIAMSLEPYNEALQKLRARGVDPNMNRWNRGVTDCVPALKKKQLVDWAITNFNRYQDLDDHCSDSYSVWIKPAGGPSPYNREP